LFLLTLALIRELTFLILLGNHAAQRWASRSPLAAKSDEERQPLLARTDAATRLGSSDGSEHSAASYGSTLQDEDGEETQDEERQGEAPEYPWEERERKAREQMEKKLLEEGNWLTYVKRFRVRNTRLIDILSEWIF
jgi:hypothetical protein